MVSKSDALLTKIFGDGRAWDERPVQRHLFLWVFPLIGLLVGGALAAVFWQQGQRDHAVGYVVNSPANCVLEVADRPGGKTLRTIDQRRGRRQTVCDAPPTGQEVYYDATRNKQMESPSNNQKGILLGVGIGFLIMFPGFVAWWALFSRRWERSV